LRYGTVEASFISLQPLAGVLHAPLVDLLLRVLDFALRLLMSSAAFFASMSCFSNAIAFSGSTP
jgi:hypothetical protein